MTQLGRLSLHRVMWLVSGEQLFSGVILRWINSLGFHVLWKGGGDGGKRMGYIGVLRPKIHEKLPKGDEIHASGRPTAKTHGIDIQFRSAAD